MANPPELPNQSSDRSAALLAELGVALVEAGDLKTTLQRLADAAREVSHARYAAIGVLADSGVELSDFITSGVNDETRAGIGDLPIGRGLLGVIITEDRAIRVDDISSDARSVGFPEGHPPMASFLGLPIRLAGRTYGNIYVTESETGSFSEQDERLLQALAAYAAIAIRGAELRDERQRWIDGLEGICGISGSMARSRELSDLLPEAVRRTRMLLGCDTVGIGLMQDGVLRFPFAHGISALRLEALETSNVEIVDVGSLIAREIPTGGRLAVPLQVGSNTVGVLVVLSHGSLSEWHSSIIDILSEHVAMAISNAEAFSDERRRLVDEADQRAHEIEERLAQEAQSKALLAQEHERARVARELHDESGQVLTGLSLRLKALSANVDPEVAAELDHLRESVREAQDSMRHILRRLRPANLEGGLGDALRTLADGVGGVGGCAVRVEVSPLPPINEEVELVLFRVSQEALTNVVRHSNATNASIELSAHNDLVRLTIEDDGVGFDSHAETDRLGLAGVQERVELVGGVLRVTSAPGTGTAVTVDVGTTPEPSDA